MFLYEIATNIQRDVPSIDDAEQIFNLKQKLYQENGDSMPRPTNIDREKLFITKFTNDPHFYFILKDGNDIIGYVSCKNTNGVGLLGIGILEQYTGMGLGSSLLKYAINIAKEKGYHQIDLEVDNNNPAKELYRRLGFQITGNNNQDTFMSLILNS